MKSATTVGVAGQFYDQIAVDSDNTSGNINLGAYDESASKPNNLNGSTGSIAMTADYAFKSMTEFAIGTDNVWLAYNKSLASGLHQKAAAVTGYYKTPTFPAMDSPFGTEVGSTTEGVKMKMSHT